MPPPKEVPPILWNYPALSNFNILTPDPIYTNKKGNIDYSNFINYYEPLYAKNVLSKLI